MPPRFGMGRTSVPLSLDSGTQDGARRKRVGGERRGMNRPERGEFQEMTLRHFRRGSAAACCRSRRASLTDQKEGPSGSHSIQTAFHGRPKNRTKRCNFKKKKLALRVRFASSRYFRSSRLLFCPLPCRNTAQKLQTLFFLPWCVTAGGLERRLLQAAPLYPWEPLWGPSRSPVGFVFVPKSFHA